MNTNPKEDTMQREYRIERLPNGFIRVDHRGSGLVSMWDEDGTHLCGPATVSAAVAVQEWLEGLLAYDES